MQTAAKSNLIFTSLSSLNSMAGIAPAIGKPELNQQISQTITRRIHRRQSINLFTESDMDEGTRIEMLEAIQKIALMKRGEKQGEDSDKDSDKD